MNFLDDAFFTIPWPWPLLMIVVAMALFAVVAWLRKSLSPSGAAAAYVMGVIVLWMLRFEGFSLMLLFFVGSNVAGKVSGNIRKRRPGYIPSQKEIEKKGSCRDWMQVLANGLMAVIASFIWYVSGRQQALVMFGAAIAEATSDTFAGEIGRLSDRKPVSIRTFTPVPPGMSGGVTVLGTVAAFLASAVIAACWYVWFSGVSLAGALLVCLMGFAGCILDSFLGSTCQAVYVDSDGELTEHDERDGQKLELSRGVRWMDNDMVNIVSNVFASVFALGMSALIIG